jgi:recombination protein RecR
MQYSSALLESLIAELTRLPGLGRKSAQRIAFHILRVPEADAKRLAASILDLKAKVRDCPICGNVTETEPCGLCADPRRDATLLCVVENAMDVLALERTGEFKGLYHVLNGAISPIDGIGPDQLRIRELLERADSAARDGEPFVEVIMATNPTLEGEATAMYLAERLETVVGVVSRIARGLPVGGDLEYADQVTLTKALEGRREIG